MQLELFPRAISKKRISTNLTARHHPVHRWFNFIAGFSPEFVTSCIHGANLSKNGLLVDPFAGLSTALVQANFEGIRSIGFEPHPFFFDMSQAKIHPPYDCLAIDDIESRILKIPPYTGDLTDIWSGDAIRFLKKLLQERELRLLAQALLAEGQIDPSIHQLYRLVVSGVLELASGSKTDGIYKAPTSKKRAVPYQEAVGTICNRVREDIVTIGTAFSRQAILYPISSENMSVLDDQSCSICVTSPPYLNNFDFAEMTRMELYFWRYASSWREITENVRRKLIVNTTTAPTDLKRAQSRFKATLSMQMRSVLDPIIEALRERRKTRAGKKDYYLLVYPYFSQMQSVLMELRRVLKIGSFFHLVVADSALYGVHVETQVLLAKLMQEIGFDVLEVVELRKRGDRWILQKRQGAKKKLGDYHIIAQRI